MTVVLWVPFGASVAVVGVAVAVYGGLVLLARTGTSGTEYIQMVRAPLFIAAYVSAYVGGISGLLLAAATEPPIFRFLTGGLGGGMVVLIALPHVARFRERRRNRKLPACVAAAEDVRRRHGQTVSYRNESEPNDPLKPRGPRTPRDPGPSPGSVRRAT